ncbi:MAG: HlyC/CorC family transporter [Lachnospiraceae bacterium]|nr:HlyC/CorC family transporter [Lachnospiraceae bacterium]
MDSGDVAQLITIIVLVFLSAFFSSAETALTTCNKIKMRTLAENGDAKAKRVLRITDDSGKMLSAILVGNNIVNLTASSLATSLATRVWGSVAVGIATGILTLVVLIFGEISPKTLATIYADRIALIYSGIISFLMKLLTPAIFIVNKLAMGFLFLLRVDPNKAENAMTEDELRTIVDVSHEEGVIETEERQMINNVFDFGDAQAKDVMVPRIDMTFASIDNTYQELLTIFQEDHYTRLPVYEGSTDNVVGIINMKDLLLYEDREQFHLRDILRKPYYTYEHKSTSELMLEMRKSSINIAIVLDEYGATAGLITLEDLLEEIVGEIRDEYDDDEEDPIQAINEREYMVQGSLNLEDLNDMLHLDLTSEDYDSVGGYLIGLLDHLPEAGESIETEAGLYLRVEDMEKNRINKVFLRLPEPAVEGTPQEAM